MTRRAGPSLGDEIRGWCSGYRHIAGVDEAGRGPMAGPVVAAAVILDPQYSAQWWSELRDSKTLTARRPRRLAQRLHDDVVLGIGLASHEEIDGLGLLEATRQAMLRALAALPCSPDLVLVDALSLPEDFPPELLKVGLAANATILTEQAGPIIIIAMLTQWIETSLDAVL